MLANQIENLLPVIQQKHGIALKYSDVQQWDLKVGTTDIAQIIKEEQSHKRYVQSMPMIPKARESMDALINKYKIVIVTARATVSDPWTKRWLVDNGIPYDAFVNIKEGSKQNIDFDASVLIDDYLGNIEEYLERSDGAAILFSQPWNKNHPHLQHYVEEGRLHIANGWEDVRSKLAQIEEMAKSNKAGTIRPATLPTGEAEKPQTLAG